jgi:serpin B
MMNRALRAATAMALMTACGGPSSTPAADAGAPLQEARSSLSRQTSPEVSPGDLQNAVAGNNAFAFDLHARLVEPGKNSMTSPFSISSALAMVWAGARGETASQLASALHFSLPQERFHPAFNALDLALQKPWDCHAECAPFTLRITNAAWAQKEYPFAPAYLDTLAANYGAGLNLLDFVGAPEAARLAINDAVARATEDKIRDLLGPGSIDSLTRLVLTNAVYFKANWEHAFDAKLTAPGSFRLLDGALARVPFLNGSVEARGVAGASYDAVELRYRDSHFAMTLVSPKSGFEAFESTFDAQALESLDAALQPHVVVLSMPKFKFEWKQSLVKALQAMGMADAFDPARADFTGICAADRLYVSDVVHQTFIAVDEIGTEAAAATAATFSLTGLPPSKIEVSFDRPFLFFIRDLTTRQVVFLGRVVDPR